MVTRTICFQAAAGLLLSWTITVHARAQSERLIDCYLYRGADGGTWVCKPVVKTGRFDVNEDAPTYRLSDELAKRFAPLVADLKDTPTDHSFPGEGLPELKDRGDTLALIDLEAEVSVARPEGNGEREAYEITSARLFEAEYLSYDYVEAWRTLRQVDSDLAELSTNVTDAATKERAAACARQAREALAVFDEEQEGWSRGHGFPLEGRIALNRIAPEARIVHATQHRISRTTREAINKHLSAFGMAAIKSREERERHEPRDTQFGGCYLVACGDGYIRPVQPMEYLGMYGVMMPPDYRFKAEVSADFQPLRTPLPEKPERTGFYGGLPRSLPDPNDVIVLLDFFARIQPHKTDAHGRRGYPRDTVHEITSAELTAAEFISTDWLEAWLTLDSTLREIVKATLEPPGEQKRGALAEHVELGRQALRKMLEATRQSAAAPANRERLDQVNKEAAILTRMQDRIASDWGDHLEWYAAALGIERDVKLPSVPSAQASRQCDLLELLAASQSRTALIETIEASCGAVRRRETMIHSRKLDRQVRVGELESLPDPWFAEVRDEAKAKIADQQRKRDAAFDTIREKWAVVLEPADAKVLADKQILCGAVVRETLPGGPEPGLEKGDIILPYGRVYDMAMGARSWRGCVWQLANTARQGGELRVLRDDELVIIEMEKQ